MIKLFVQSLGCPKNTVDTELMIGYLKNTGDVRLIDDIEESDVILINTCGFITPAKEESVDEILNAIEVKKRRGDKKIVVAGCLYERYKEQLKKELPEVDSFIGVYELDKITDIVLSEKLSHPKPYMLREKITPEHIGYLKIADGCSNGCSFCAIPLIKGGFRSRSEEELYDEAVKLAEEGTKELYIIAQDTTAYMFENNKRDALISLLKKLETIDKIEWIRLMYTYPPHITDELLDFVSSSTKVLNYIDVPLQHINDRILKSMNRKHTKKEALKLIEKLKERDIAIRSTFIVGYPQETEAEFNELCDFIERYEIDWAGFFMYYREENTKAFGLVDLDREVKEERLNRIKELQDDVYLSKHERLVGKEFEVIIDGESEEMPGFFEARPKRSAYEIDGIVFLEEKNLKQGEIVKSRLQQSINTTDFIATIIKT